MSFRADSLTTETESPMDAVTDYARTLEEIREKSVEAMKQADELGVALHLDAAAIREAVENAQIALTGWLPR